MRSLQGHSLFTLFLLVMILVPCAAYGQEAKQKVTELGAKRPSEQGGREGVAPLALPMEGATRAPVNVHLVVGRSKVIRVPFTIRQVFVSDPKVADITLLSPTQISLLGKGVGETSLFAQGKKNKKDRQISMELFVESDLTLLKEKLHLLLPEEPIEVYSLKDGLLLKGEVSSGILLSAVLSIADPFAPGKVTSLIQVGGVPQVLLKVNIVEMSRSNMDRLGINLAYEIKDTFMAFTNLGGGAPFVESLVPVVPNLNVYTPNNTLGVGSNNNLILGAANRHLFGFIDALNQNGLAKVLAEPTLMAVSGEEASFLVGGGVSDAGSTRGFVRRDYRLI